MTPVHRIKTRREHCGSVMIDVVFALFIAILAYLPISALLVAAQLLDRQAQLQSIATNAADLELESLRQQSYANTAAMTSGTFPIPSSLLAVYPNVSMVGTYDISNTGIGDSSHGVTQIAVMVTWTRPDIRLTTSSVRLDSYEAEGAS